MILLVNWLIVFIFISWWKMFLLKFKSEASNQTIASSVLFIVNWIEDNGICCGMKL